jgi:twin BRCT domain
LKDAALWLGATILSDDSDVNNLQETNGRKSIIIAEEVATESTADNHIYISPYYISKLLGVRGSLPGPGAGLLGTFPPGMSDALKSFLILIYSPSPRREMSESMQRGSGGMSGVGNVDLAGSIFAVSGFGDNDFDCDCDCDAPSKRDVMSGVRYIGGYTAATMVEGLTTHLLCKVMSGDKYNIAKRWGAAKIRVVHWEWLLLCMTTGTAVEPFEEVGCSSADIGVGMGVGVGVGVGVGTGATVHATHTPVPIGGKQYSNEGEYRPMAVSTVMVDVPESQASFNFYASLSSQVTDSGNVANSEIL